CETHARVLDGSADYGNLGMEKRRRIALCANESYLEDFIAGLERDEIRAITKTDPLYPPLLLNIPDPPYVLYARGAMAESPIASPVSAVGTRRCSDYGRTVADMMGRTLSENGATVISGLAYGCDSYAHEGALKSERSPYPTAAVLGQGVLVSKSDNTQKTLEKILERGVILSEYLPRTKATQYSFPMRNRIISGISPALLVIEAGKKSGTMITVSCALEQGRDVYAVPCRITEQLNCGTNDMLKKGWAQPVYGAEDLVEMLGLARERAESHTVSNGAASAAKTLSGDVRIVYETLLLGEKSIDELLEKTEIPQEKLILHLTELEFSGLIKQLPCRVYSAE
ncbi:MAG: DNA-processing protein DprA, partial [Clostridia bacterium]|nr:DNA-processing protein DprA [Clostridia bacterium]